MNIKEGGNSDKIMDWPLAFTIVSGLVSLCITAYFSIRSLRKQEAEAEKAFAEADKADGEKAEALVNAATALLQPYISRVTELETRVVTLEMNELKLRARIKDLEDSETRLKAGVTTLITQLVETGMEPRWRP